MSFGEIGLAAVGLYLAGLVVVAEVARRSRRDETPADHFLAGRGLGTFVLFLTLYATAYSGNSLLGYPGEAYRRGFAWIMATGFMMAIIVTFHALAPKLRPIAVRHRFVTPGDWVRLRFGHERFGRALRLAVGLLMALALANFLFAQLKAMGELAHEVTGGLIPYEAGVIGLAALILFYETLGGMRAVAWTDAAQGVLMLVGLALLLSWLLGDGGGLAKLTADAGAVRPATVAVPDAVECANWFSTIILLGIASVIYPQAIQRIFAAKSGRALKRAFSGMTFMPLTTTLVVTLIGLAAIPRFAALGEADADRVMPLLLGEWAATGPLASIAAILVFVGALAAIMSTADSVLLSLGSIVAKDLDDRLRDPAKTTRFGKLAAAMILVAMVVAAMNREITLWRLIELKMELLIQCAPAFLLAIHWKRLRAGPVLAGILVGTLLALVAVLTGYKRVGGFHIGVLSLVVNTLIAVVGSLPRRPDPEAAVRSPSDGMSASV